MSAIKIACVSISAASAVLAVGAFAAPCARAQNPSFPVDDAYVPMRCSGMEAMDPRRDQPGSFAEADVVGVPGAPALLYALDATHLFVRLRVDESAERPGMALAGEAWGVLFDTDGDRTTYEVLLLADGDDTPDLVYLRTNDATVTPNDPADDAETLVVSDPVATHARATPAGSMIGGDPDGFVTIAVSLADLAALAVGPGPAVMWAGTSSNTTSLDGDIVCHDADDGDEDPALDAIVLEPLPLGPGAPTDDSDGDGLLDSEECTRTCPDSDRDGFPDHLDADDDGDGVNTADELARDAMARPRDTDGDGRADYLDADDDDDGLLTRDERAGDLDRDTDGDGAPDHRDDDDDADTILTRDERADSAALEPPTPDVDADGFANWFDGDADEDGAGDGAEGREDSDGDELPDYLDRADGIRGYVGGALCRAAPGPLEGGSRVVLAAILALGLFSRRRLSRRRLPRRRSALASSSTRSQRVR